ncbi:leucine-rich repeat domain-containing protein [Cohnella cholangitidis]|uniref:Leucine-rich repeat domain-containing protein n=1 Tax=Cohnella cholangitidis TaxID=2598458 RepID=A0A7G5C4E6_9BACL|nr:leucine-rich repeat domain-containing protein [Cohnella cholangitidis]QMV44080.1 leucine-rich repeat domain-containing protein [Cohnella cholangitidis]
MRKSVLCLGMALLVLWTSLAQVQPAHAEEEGGFSYTVAGTAATLKGYTGGQLGVNIPATLGGLPVTVIGREAFDADKPGQTKITSVAIPDSVANIQIYAFRNNNLSSVDLPESLTTIGASAFEGNLLTSVVFPDSMISIGSYAFYRNKLTSIKLNENLKTISGGAFDTNQIAKLVIPAGVTSVADYAFFRSNLTSVTVLGAATTFGATAFHENPANMKIFAIANSPAATLAASRGYAFVDGTALFQGVETAKSLLKDHLPGTGVGQVSATAHADLTNAHAAARLFIDGIGNATVASDLTSAAAPLGTAISTFEAAIVQAGDATALGSKITEANQALADHPAGTNVGQTTVGARSALQVAVNAAQQVYSQAANYTQAPLDAAAADLNAAIVAFKATLIQAGSATALGSKIVEANQALTDHPAGTGVGQTLSGDYYALKAAVDTAQNVFNQAANYTQTQLDGAIAVLDFAIDTFEAKIIQAGNAAALGAKLGDARQALTDHPEGTNVGETSGADRTTLLNAINAAQAIFDDAANRTQGQLNTAVADLNGAVTAFGAVIVPAGNAAALGTKLGDARQALTDHPEGTNVGETSGADRTTLLNAINAAQAIFDDAANRTQGQLNTAVADLNGAVTAFGAVIVPAGNAAALGTKLGDARQALTDHPEGTNVGETSGADRTTLLNAINAAQAIFDDAANRTQGQLNTAVADLNGAVTAFGAVIVPAGNAAALGTKLGDARQALTDHPEGTNVGEASGRIQQTLLSD